MLTLAAGLPLAWAIGRFRFRGRSLARALVLVPFVLPTVVVATAFLTLLPAGYERGLWAILAAHVFFNLAVVDTHRGRRVGDDRSRERRGSRRARSRPYPPGPRGDAAATRRLRYRPPRR